MSKNQAEICKTFFKLLESENDTWLCKCGRKLKQRKGTGWSNLYAHIKVQHQQKSETVANDLPDQPTLSHPIYGIVSKKAQNLYGWLDWVCMELKPFEFVESDLTRKYTNLQPICRKTLMKYMHLTTLEVEKAITKSLPDRFALLLDGWTHHSTHFLAVFASFMENSEPNSVLLSFSPLMDELRECCAAKGKTRYVHCPIAH